MNKRGIFGWKEFPIGQLPAVHNNGTLWLRGDSKHHYFEWSYNLTSPTWHHWHFIEKANDLPRFDTKKGVCIECGKVLPKQYEMLALLQKLK